MTKATSSSILSTSALTTSGSIAAIIAASVAMSATLPGRTHGLGMVTTRLLADFPVLSESNFAQINLVATILGSILCLPCGWLIDRFGMRTVSAWVLVALGFVVIWMSNTTSLYSLCIAMTLTRGIGQSMLSVVSLAIVGKSFPHRPGKAMGAYAVLLTFLMAAWTGYLGYRVTTAGWRTAWSEVGWGVILTIPIVSLCTPKTLLVQSSINERNKTRSRAEFATLAQAIKTSCFWVFALSISLFGMISSGVSLFQQSILASKGFSEQVYHNSLVLGLFIGMAANLVGGWLATKYPMQYLLSGALMLLAASLVSLIYLSTTLHAYAFCVAYSMAGGFITVLYFTVWGQAFGMGSLAKIQGAAQMMTVFASSIGPLFVTESKASFQSYDVAVWAFSIASIILGLIAIRVTVTSCTSAREESYDGPLS